MAFKDKEEVARTCGDMQGLAVTCTELHVHLFLLVRFACSESLDCRFVPFRFRSFSVSRDFVVMRFDSFPESHATQRKDRDSHRNETQPDSTFPRRCKDGQRCSPQAYRKLCLPLP